MNLTYWEKLSPYLYSKKIIDSSGNSNLIKLQTGKTKFFVNIFRSKKEKIKNNVYKNPIFLPQDSLQNCITSQNHTLNFKNLYLPSYFPKIFFLNKLTTQLTFFKTSETSNVHHKKYIKFNRENHAFFETETIINWNFYLNF